MPNLYKVCCICFLVVVSMLLSCKDDEAERYLELKENSISFSHGGGEQIIEINTNVDGLTAKVNGNPDWCTAVLSGKSLVVSVTGNDGTNEREACITVTGSGLKGNLIVTQAAFEDGLKEDQKITVAGGAASSVLQNNPAEGPIEFSFDGKLNTIYHSQLAIQNPNLFPVTLTYNFGEATDIDYLTYIPRTGSSDGNFKEFDLYYHTTTGALVKYGTFNFMGSSGSSRINFPEKLKNVAGVQFVVKSGVNGVLSCAEMEFYKKSTDNYDYLSIFTDDACSELKSDVTASDIENISNPFFKDLAAKIFRGEYDSEFRVQEYSPYQYPGVMAEKNKTDKYSLRDNATGIYISDANEDLIVMVGDLHGQSVSLSIQDLENTGFAGVTYALSKGINKIKAADTGLIYVNYHTNKATELPVKLNFVTGTVNGYYNNQKHTVADWNRILNGATYKELDVLGKYAHLTFPTSKFKEFTPDGMALISAFDSIVFWEQDFMGLRKYNRMFNNRLYLHIDYEDSGWMYAASYHTGYVMGTMANLCNLHNLKTVDPWGPAHEIGHINQTRPVFLWKGMAEVTNNIHSLYVQTKFGTTSSLLKNNYYNAAITEIVNGKIAHNASTNVFHKLVPFWQLKLYLHDVLGESDFYKDLYQHFREIDNPVISGDTHGVWQLNFVYSVCIVSGIDFTDFFESWGFMKPINMEIDDYGKAQFTITQEQINEVKKKISNLNLPKPAQANIHTITDNNIADFK